MTVAHKRAHPAPLYCGFPADSLWDYARVRNLPVLEDWETKHKFEMR
jgi:hypothetical protein